MVYMTVNIMPCLQHTHFNDFEKRKKKKTTTTTMNDDIFTRIFEIESEKKELTLYQQNVGDVSCVVWDAALVLAKYLDVLSSDERLGGNWLVGKKILELGAGVGCVGMTAACLGAQVVMTDLESTLPMLKKNIINNEKQWKNSGSIEAQTLDWGNKIELDFQPDIVLLADCIYYSESIQPLINTLEYFCKNKKTYAILSQEERDTPGQVPVWKEFLSELKKKFQLKYIPTSQQHPTYSSDDIHLVELTYL